MKTLDIQLEHEQSVVELSKKDFTLNRMEHIIAVSNVYRKSLRGRNIYRIMMMGMEMRTGRSGMIVEK